MVMLDWNDYRSEIMTLGGAGAKTGHPNGKIRELIALAVAITLRCDRCIAVHTAAAKKLGATREVRSKIVERLQHKPERLAAERVLVEISASRTGMARPTSFLFGVSDPIACRRNCRRRRILSSTSPTTAVNNFSRKLENRASPSILAMHCLYLEEGAGCGTKEK
jgi:AhpD family alkylhydroperoxidase